MIFNDVNMKQSMKKYLDFKRLPVPPGPLRDLNNFLNKLNHLRNKMAYFGPGDQQPDQLRGGILL